MYAGVELGVFDVVEDRPKHAVEIADQLEIDPGNGYRLLRALGSLGLLEESADRRFSATPAGELLRADHPRSLRGMVLLEEGPSHYALWTHLPDLVREGEQNAFERELGAADFVEHRENDPEYARIFNEAMTAYSRMQTAWTREMLSDVDFSTVSQVCDVGGGHGHLLCSLLRAHEHLEGTVLELPDVIADEDQLLAAEMGVADRCSYVAGDMFEAVPSADVYLLKQILHDWSDEECREILSTVREGAPDGARLFVIERLVPGPETPHFAKLFDVHMLVASTGRERTTDEYAALLKDAGWTYVDTHRPEEGPMGAVEGVIA